MASNDDRQDERSGGKGEEVEVEERTDMWMATYSDMVTLLMTFFVLMFAISNVDSSKAAMLFAAWSKEGLTQEAMEKIVEIYGPPSEDYEDTKVPPPGPPTPEPPDEPGLGEISNPEMDALAASIQNYINENGLGDSIALLYNGDELMLTLANDVWFDSGSAVISEGMKEYALVIAQLIADTFNPEKPFNIVVSGHTDNIPIHTPQYPSNWYVSMDRATNFLELLIHDSDINPYYFSAKGCGEERPIASNDTPEGRQANRRVEVMISLASEVTIGPSLSSGD